jgi:beta-N-acetylhexosaminidase
MTTTTGAVVRGSHGDTLVRLLFALAAVICLCWPWMGGSLSRSRGLVVVAVTLIVLAFGAASASAARSLPIIPRLSDSQLAGQRTIYSYHGLLPPPDLFDRIRSGRAGGVIFFGENVQSASQIKAVVNQLQAAAMSSPVRLPLLIMTDQEGGIVKRLPGEPVLSAKQMGASPNNVAVTRREGRLGGLNLLSGGINVNLAPVLGVFRQPGNFLDRFGRSFSSNPFTVRTLGTTFLRAQQKTGVAATVKHFPGSASTR